MPKIKNILIFVVIGAVFALGYFFFIRKDPEPAPLVSSNPTSSPLGENAVVPGMSDQALAQDFLNLLLSVKSIKLDVAIFSDAAFAKLDGSHSITLVQDGTEGRPNPFAPLGSDPLTPPAPPAITPAAGGTSSTGAPAGAGAAGAMTP
jgi:hypothetical protein